MAKLLTFINVRKASNSNSLNDDQLENREIRNDEMVKRENVKGTPFSIIQTKHKTFIALGMYQVSQGTLNYKECKEAIENKEWTLILNVARLIAMDEIKVNQETKQAEKKEKFIRPEMNKYYNKLNKGSQ